MTGEARKVLSELLEGVQSAFALVKDTLEEHFGLKGQMLLLRTKVRSYYRNNSETVMQLGVSIRQ